MAKKKSRPSMGAAEAMRSWRELPAGWYLASSSYPIMLYLNGPSGIQISMNRHSGATTIKHTGRGELIELTATIPTTDDFTMAVNAINASMELINGHNGATQAAAERHRSDHGLHAGGERIRDAQVKVS